jgi:glutathione S-transferase
VSTALPALTTLVAVLLYYATAVNVGRMRVRHKIEAPAVTGHPEFECAFRVQMNTLEQLAAFLPSLWLFALYVSAPWASAIGAAWIAGRALYAVGYLREPKQRGVGFVTSFAALAVLWLGATWGVVSALLRG